MNRQAVAVLLSLSAVSCASEPLEFADWTIPVPEGTWIIEYPAVAREERVENLRVEKDLVLTEAFGQPLYRPAQVALGPDGKV